MNWTISGFSRVAGSENPGQRQIAIAKLLLALLILVSLGGCASVHLYDPSRDATAQLAVEQHKNTNLAQVSEDASELLDGLLQQEIAAAAAGRKFLFDNDVFRIAASNDGDEFLLDWVAEIDEKIKSSGIEKRSHILKALDNASNLSGKTLKMELLARDSSILAPELAKDFPDCNNSLPELWPPIGSAVSTDIFDFLSSNYAEFKTACLKALQIPSPKYLKANYEELRNQEGRIKKKRDQASTVRKEIHALKKMIEDATKIGQLPSKQLTTAIENLQDKIKDARKIQGNLGVDILTDDTLSSIAVILTSLAGEQFPESSDQSAEFHESVAFLSQVPSLADSAAMIAQQAEKPPVAHLVIEMNRQLLLRNYYQRVAAIEEQSVEYLKDLVGAKQEQVKSYWEFVTELCNYGYENPGEKCADLELIFTARECDQNSSVACEDQQLEPVVSDCVLPSTPSTNVACPLKVTWAQALDNRTSKRRHVLGAIVALSNSHRAAARIEEINYRITDLKYRKALLLSENAIAQWNNLIQIPVEQVAAFYNAGIKPEAVGDFIVKSLALAGVIVAVGSL